MSRCISYWKWWVPSHVSELRAVLLQKSFCGISLRDLKSRRTGRFFDDFTGFLFTINIYQVIQAVTFSSPILGGHLSFERSLNHPKKVAKNCQVLEFSLETATLPFWRDFGRLMFTQETYQKAAILHTSKIQYIYFYMFICMYIYIDIFIYLCSHVQKISKPSFRGACPMTFKLDAFHITSLLLTGLQGRKKHSLQKVVVYHGKSP